LETKKKTSNEIISYGIVVFWKIRKPKYWKISNKNIANTNGPILNKLSPNL
jgi:hypothetical protein